VVRPGRRHATVRCRLVLTTVTRVLRRAGRRTNLGLLLLLVGSFVTGWLAFATDGPVSARAAAVAHGVLGLGLVVLTPWKVVVARRAPRLRAASLGLAAVVLVCLVAGVVEVLAGPDVRGGLTPIQVHVGAAFVLVALLVVHVARHWRPRLARVTDLGRRRLLRTAAFGAGAGVTFLAVEAVGRVGGSAAARAPTGSHPIAPEDVPATIWLLDRVPALDRAAHRVRIGDGLLSAAELDARGRPVAARLDCTTGWYADAVWTGVTLSSAPPPLRARRAPPALPGHACAGRAPRRRDGGTGPAGRPRLPRLLVGQVGGLGRAEPLPGPRAVPVPAAVTKDRERRQRRGPWRECVGHRRARRTSWRTWCSTRRTRWPTGSTPT
jgi:hypothetical protein